MRQSELLTKTRKTVSEQEHSINAQLLERAGYISKLMAGVYSYLPLGLKVLKNVETIVREEMDAVGGQEILMPSLQPKEIWEKSGRWNEVDVLYKLKVSDREFSLGPTHEEVVTPLVGAYIKSYKDLPKAVYQIQTKFRNEARPKSGLLRGREFRMKDLYSFHKNEEDLDQYYDEIIKAYLAIFRRCGIGQLTYLTHAAGGIFSKYSHEFQTITPFGEDTIYLCRNCDIAVNQEIIAEQSTCPKCGNSKLENRKSIEVGNIFKLKTRFTDVFGVSYTDAAGNINNPIMMGCYGIGTSRLVGAIVEVLHDDRGIIWPLEIAPFKVHLISLLQEDKDKANLLYQRFQEDGIGVLFDDRVDISAGEKFADADLLGMPWRIIISAKTLHEQSVEVKIRGGKESTLISLPDITNWLKGQLESVP